ncbi:unannotated protein [freshwater metagenome]|uniref:Unannotated protein n=1 Tax=freshwater metagenome TaxID=449393 RepID=A0A6J7G582_9ZZZZ
MIVGKKLIPLASPDNFDYIPACAPKEGLKFLDDFAVTSYRTIKSLQVGVYNESQVV